MNEADTARDDSPVDERSNVDRIYIQLKSMAAAFVLKPGERVNESVLAKKLKVSRTPLREALNRLTTEGFMEIRTGKGFFRKMLDPKEVFDLFQLRVAIECSGIALVVSAAQDEDLDALEAFLDETGGDQSHRPVLDLVQLDERFHETLLGMSGNVEFVRVLGNINSRIRFVRWVDIGRRGRLTTQAEHRAILQAVRDRDGVTASQLLEKHIERRMDEVTSTIREGFSRIYMGEGPVMEAMRDG